MQHLKNKSNQNKKSHILIELLVLLLVIAAISFFAIPKISDMLSSSKTTAANKDAEIVSIATQAWLTEQETAELLPTVNDKNELSSDDITKIVANTKLVDDVTAKTVIITVKGNTAPLCYQVSSVKLSKDNYQGSYTVK